MANDYCNYDTDFGGDDLKLVEYDVVFDDETAYPSTFILDGRGKILFEKISHSHGDRTTGITSELAISHQI
jgi:hypothetical protein